MTKSICEFFLHCHDIESDVLVSQFPPQSADFNCFKGICERLDLIRVPQSPILKTLAPAHLATLSRLHAITMQTILPGNDTHAFDYVKSTLEGRPRAIPAAFEISGNNFLQVLNSYPQEFYNEAMRRLPRAENYEAEILALANKIISSFPLGEIITLQNGEELIFSPTLKANLEATLVGKGISLEDADPDFYRFKNFFEEKFLAQFAQNFEIAVEDPFEYDDSEKLKLDYEKLKAVIASHNEAKFAPLEQGVKKYQSLAQREEATSAKPLACSNKSNLAKALLSPNFSEMLEALNAIYAYSKPGYESYVFYVFRDEIFAAAQELKARFATEIAAGNSLFMRHNFKLENYLQRAENGRRVLGESEPLCRDILARGIDSVDCRAITIEKYLFILTNLAVEDAKHFLDKMTPTQAVEMFKKRSEFGRTVSAFSPAHLSISLASRADFDIIFHEIANKVNQNEECKEDFLGIITDLFFLVAQFNLEHAMTCLMGTVRTQQLSQENNITLFQRTNPQSMTALMIAARQGRVGVFQIMINSLKQMGIQGKPLVDLINFSKQPFGPSAMSVAVANGKGEITRIIIAEMRQAGLTGKELFDEINKPNVEGFTPFLEAADLNNIAILRNLIEVIKVEKLNREDLLNAINHESREGHTAFVSAAFRGHGDIFNILITTMKEAGITGRELVAQTIKKNQKGDSPLTLAISQNHLEVYKSITREMRDAGMSGREILAAINEAGAPNFAVVMLVVKAGDVLALKEIIEMLKESGISGRALINQINMSNYNGLTPLVLSIANGSAEVFDFLLATMQEQGMGKKELIDTINLRYGPTDTILTFATKNSNGAVVKSAIAAIKSTGIEGRPFVDAINQQNASGYTPLVLAAIMGNKEIVREIIYGIKDAGFKDGELIALLSARTPNNHSPLTQAAEKGHEDIFCAILDEVRACKDGRRIIEGDKQFTLSITFAIKNGHNGILQTMIDTLKKVGFNTKEIAENFLSYTPDQERNNHIMNAIMLGHKEIVQTIISTMKEAGHQEFLKHIHIRSGQGLTALEIAQQNGQSEIATILESAINSSISQVSASRLQSAAAKSKSGLANQAG